MNIVFISIGTNQVHMLDAIRQVRRWCGHKIWVVCHTPREIVPIAAKLGNMEIVQTDSLSHPALSTFRKLNWLKGFWDVTFQRLFVLQALMEKHSLTDVVHLENDVLVYRDTGHHLSTMQKHAENMVLLTPVGQFYASAAWLYSETITGISYLNTWILKQLQDGEQRLRHRINRPDFNEMVLLSWIQRSWPDRYLKYLPILPNGHPACHEIRKYKSLWDGASWGQYVGGTPQGHNAGILLDHHWVGSEMKKYPDRYAVDWDIDELDRKVPFLLHKGTGRRWRFNNLHIHCKNLKSFM